MPKTNNFNIDVKASQDEGGSDIVNITGLAYSGNPIRQWGGVLAIDLDGIEFANQIPLLDSHDNSTESKLGEVVARRDKNGIVIEGKITSTSAKAKAIIADGKNSDWQLSIGANLLKAPKFIDEDTTIELNGQKMKGPMLVADKAILREVSVVAVGADHEAIMHITASYDTADDLKAMFQSKTKGVKTMDGEDKNKTPEGVKAGNETPPKTEPTLTQEDVNKAIKLALEEEQKRVSDIMAAFNGEYPEIQAKAISEKWDMNKVNATLLSKIREDRPQVGKSFINNEPSRSAEEIECALCLRLGHDANKMYENHDYDEKTIEAAEKFSNISLKDVVRECVRMSGGTVNRLGFGDADIRAGFSTLTLPAIMANVANKVMMKAYKAVPMIAPQLCSVGSYVDFKPTNRVRMTDVGKLQRLAPDGEFKHGELAEESASNQIDTFGEMFALTRKDIINDDMNAFTKIPKMLGAEAAKLIDDLFFERLLGNYAQADGQKLFSSAHKNTLTGEVSVFGVEALKKAIEMFERQTNAQGEPISVSPKFLLVPTELKWAAKAIFASPVLQYTGTKEQVHVPANVVSDEDIKIISTPKLINPLEWYLFASPDEIDTFEIGYLNGKSTPTIQQGEVDFNKLGIQYRIFYDTNVKEQDHRGVFKGAGK